MCVLGMSDISICRVSLTHAYRIETIFLNANSLSLSLKSDIIQDTSKSMLNEINLGMIFCGCFCFLGCFFYGAITNAYKC